MFRRILSNVPPLLPLFGGFGALAVEGETVSMDGAPIWLRIIVWVFSAGSVVLGFVLVVSHLIRKSDEKTERVVRGTHAETAQKLESEFQSFRAESLNREQSYRNIEEAISRVSAELGEHRVIIKKLVKDTDAYHEWKREMTPIIAKLLEQCDPE